MQTTMFVPRYHPEIVKKIRSADWLIHNFGGDDVDVYNAADYQHNLKTEGIKYKVILDMNCLQYLLNLVKRSQSDEFSRIAVAYLVFFQISDLELDPTYAIYEKINYSDDRAEEAILNLEQFRGINNHSLHDLAAYALGYEQKLHIQPVVTQDRATLRNELLQYRRLTDWDSLYLCVLAITCLATDSSVTRSKKIHKFIDWCISDFRFSLAALVYAVVLFGKLPTKRLMKYKSRARCAEKHAALRNMTWDLYYIDQYMKSWAGKNEHTECLLLSADTGLKLTLKLATACQLAGGLEPLRPHLEHEFQSVVEACANRSSVNRAYKSERWGHEYRDELIKIYESKLL